ncbi:MAG: hypothetical protein H6Q52_3282, partial [Deltaproteobacteria bacterium]|nr:hypothetical protein [Deltaproteobacteria bacterium]
MHDARFTDYKAGGNIMIVDTT